MWFKLIGLPPHIIAIKRNHSDLVALFSPLRFVFIDMNQVFPSNKLVFLASAHQSRRIELLVIP